MDKTSVLTESRYIRPSREINLFTSVSLMFLFVLYVVPQYFGIPFSLFDFTVLRIMLIIMFLFLFGIKQRQQEFIHLIVTAPYSKILIPYLLVITYTAVLRVDINAMLNPVIELISFYTLVYIIQYGFGIKKTLRYILTFSYILATLGLVEYVIGRSLFSYLETIQGLSSGQFIRSGYYRIMGPANHSLGYGLILITMIPVVCFDIEKEEINLLKHKYLFIMVVMNIFFTGSRSTLSVFVLEVALLVILSKKNNIKKYILIGSLILAVFVTFLIVFRQTTVAQYFLLQITSVLDELMGTTYSVRYGADIDSLGSSSNYRDQLIYIFQVEWLNPLLGIGRNRSFSSEINGSFIRSIDSFYIAEFVRYAYPGMICYIVFLLYFLIRMFRRSLQYKSQISRMLLVGSLCYCINIVWLDSLQTLKYLYVLFAIFCCLPENPSTENNIVEKVENQPSKYIKVKRGMS